MTIIEFTRNDNEKTLTLKIDGHSGYAESGKDIICAAISILTYTLAEHLAVVYERGVIKDKPIVKLEDGSAQIECKTSDPKAYSYLLGKFMFVMVGYELIKNTYPEYVDLKIN